MAPSFRSLLLAALFGLGTFTACQKAPVEPDGQSETSLAGRWQLTQTSGGISGRTQPADPQQVNILVMFLIIPIVFGPRMTTPNF